MCGFNGFYVKSYVLNLNDLIEDASHFNYRGPDGEGYFCEGNIGLGHKRLAITDVSNASAQPFYSKDGRYVLVFNGEIYNYKELSNKLSVGLKTKGDTEIIIELFAQFGTSCFRMLNGMYAFALYDKMLEKVYLVRDRLGIKPLYYFWDSENLLFASEISSLKRLQDRDWELNFISVQHFLQFGFIPSPETIYRNIFKLTPGSYLEFGKHLKFPENRKFDTINNLIKSETYLDERSIKKDIKRLLINAVSSQIPQEVTSGILFSGGVDSSLIASIAKYELGLKLPLFCLGVKGVKNHDNDYAKKIATHLKFDLNNVEISKESFYENVEEITNFFDEPYDSSSAIPSFLLLKTMKSKVKVALAGEGADELFLGYNTYRWSKRLHNFPFKMIPELLRKSLKFTTLTKVSFLLDKPSLGYTESHIFSQEQGFFSDKEIVNNFRFANRAEPNLEFANKVKIRTLDVVEKQSFFDLNYYLPDDLLMKLDTTSMRNSIEGRVPFLDSELVEYVLNIDSSIRLKNSTNKYLLKELLGDYLPEKLYTRPKLGFTIPVCEWFRQLLAGTQFDKDLNKVNQNYSLYDSAYIIKIKKEFLEGNDYLFGRIWLIYLLNKWIIKNT